MVTDTFRFVNIVGRISVGSFRVEVFALWGAIVGALFLVNGSAADAMVPFVLVWLATAIAASFCMPSRVWKSGRDTARALIAVTAALTLVNNVAILLAFALEDQRLGGFWTSIGSITYISAFVSAPVAVGSAVAMRVLGPTRPL
jgi:hypothetical protein